MKKKYVILISFVACLLTLAATMALAIGLAWKLTVADEIKQLTSLAETSLNRATRAFKNGDQLLRQLSKNTAAACSDTHISIMRQAVLEHPEFEEIGYFINGALACSSWGVLTSTVIPKPSDFITVNGMRVATDVSSPFTDNSARIGLQLGEYNVLINPYVLSDPINNNDVQLTIATRTGVVLSAYNYPDKQVIKALATEFTGKFYAHRLTVILRSGDLIAVSSQSQADLFGNAIHQHIPLLLLSGLLGIALIACIVCYAQSRLSPLSQLAFAVKKKQFVVYYQPIIDLNTGYCVGAEALVRWQRDDGTIVAPDLFIPLAEQSGLILPMTDQVIEQVIADIGGLLASQHQLHIAINVAAEDIKTGRVIDVLTEALNLKDIKSDQLWIEVTERGLIDITPARQVIEQARRLGYRVAIDDFGTGYSSLSHLQGLPLDTLKIDKSFVDTIKPGMGADNLTDHIVAMAHALNLEIVAEGIETQAQADYLNALNVDYGQGWLFSKPLPAAQFIDYCQPGIVHYTAARTTSS